MREIISYVGSTIAEREGRYNLALLSVVAIGVGGVVQSLCVYQLFFQSTKIGLHARAATMGLIWQRVATMKSSQLSGENSVLNHAEIDTARINEGFQWGHFSWSGIMELVVNTGFYL